MLNVWTMAVFGVLFEALTSTYVLAQAQPQMPIMGGEMPWPMVAVCVLVVVVLVLAAAALVKYVFFR